MTKLGNTFSGQGLNCSDTGWEKLNGVRPEVITSQTILYSAVNSKGITRPCFEKCELMNCTAFIVDVSRSICYSVQMEDNELVPEANSTFYQQICIKVPPSCGRERLWQVERNVGAVFIDSAAFNLQQSITKNQCYEKCIETGKSCESAQFRTTKPLSIKNAVGKCSLSLFERGVRPQAYRASMYRDEYLRDQCRNVSKQEYCSYAEYQNASLPYSDIALGNLNETECERRCDLSIDGFICRAYTFDNSTGVPNCLLHAEDTIGLGVSSLITIKNVIYREREPCLDLKVRCNETRMIIELKTRDPFFGRMYVNGYSERCGVQGHGTTWTVLTLPIPRIERLHEGVLQCGLNPAYSVDNRNRTLPLVWTTILVQFNPIVQRLGDQAIRVGCSLNDLAQKNITVESSFNFLDPNAGVPPISSTIVNASSEVPTVTMKILDENMKDAVVTHLGQKLTLKIQMSPANGPYHIEAGHLVASSSKGEASYLLLDEVGCPTDPATFPPLRKDPKDDRSLISTFTAFKFPDSQVVRFNVLVRFCLDKCTPTVCNGGQVSYGRRRRSSDPQSSESYSAEVTQMSLNEAPEEFPLQLSIIVQSAVVSTADRLLSRENSFPDTVLISGKNSLDSLFCVDASLALGLLIFWLIVQILLIVGCLLAVAQYRKTAIRAEEDRANVLVRHLYGIHGGNLDIARRVRWADHNVSSSSLG
ncbi:uncharacterized protein LOC143183416 [Calliopsis andreniformis]|uniref:uncharacterized protein LOC143183416 n=1 Tax=Calliopsis andreniformis TaxID=337506 RepID=UPI003FCE3173